MDHDKMRTHVEQSLLGLSEKHVQHVWREEQVFFLNLSIPAVIKMKFWIMSQNKAKELFLKV